MHRKFSFIDNQITQIKKENLHRKLRNGKVEGPKITIGKKKLLNLCSNDYLAIPVSKTPLRQMQSSSRLVSGNDTIYKILESKLAKHKLQQSSLVFPTGYMANLGAVSSLAQKGDLILSDELNHASLIAACRLSGAKIQVYKHNDIEDLESKLNKKSNRKFIITEGIFSMDGDYANVKEISKTAEKKGAIIILDDAHGDFVAGIDGKGTASKFKVLKKIDVYVSSLSKGLGSFGGYVASKKNVIDFLINKSKEFIYTSALPSSLIDYSIKRFDYNREAQRKKLEKNTTHISNGLQKIGYDISSSTHIIPIIIGDEKKVMRFGQYLFDNGVYAQPIRYPTVPKNSARIRISVTAWLNSRQIDCVLEVFDSAWKKFKLN